MRKVFFASFFRNIIKTAETILIKKKLSETMVLHSLQKNRRKNYIFRDINCFNLKAFILPRVAELFNHKEKQRGCPLLGANRYTHIYISYICVYNIYYY